MSKDEQGSKIAKAEGGKSHDESATTDVAATRTESQAQSAGQTESQVQSTPFTAATTCQKIVLAFILFGTTALILWWWFATFRSVEESLNQETRVKWEKPDGLILKSGPASFVYDRASNQLVVRGAVDRALKTELVGLVESAAPTDSGANPAAQTYRLAIDDLAYKSNELLKGVLYKLLLVGALSGLLGAQLRSLNNFVGVCCYKNVLDVVRWWPWYVIRPLSGFILGTTIVVLIEAGLFKAGETTPSGTVWWVAVALLAGFGADEFTLKIRLLTQTLFGQATEKSREGTDKSKEVANKSGEHAKKPPEPGSAAAPIRSGR